MPVEAVDAPSGAQSVQRAITVLRAIAAHRGDGIRLSELVDALCLNKATVRRLLLVLIAEGLVTQESQSRLYRLGFDLYALGLVASRGFNMRSLCADSVRRVADEAGDTVYLAVRTGNESVCVAHETGAYPIKIMNLSIGDRRPLGIGSGNVAMLAALPQPEIDSIVAALSERLQQLVPSLGAAELFDLVAQVKARGYHFHNGHYLPGIKSLSMAIRNPRGEPEAALTIAAIESRMGDDRLPDLVALLKREVATIEERLNSGS